MCNADKRAELRAFYKNPAWSHLVDHLPDDKIESKLNQLRKAREWRLSNTTSHHSST